MATGNQNDNEVMPWNLRKQLALAVRSIQWTYAIFWSISATQPAGTLKWGDGCYNGGIKTRKTVESVELNDDEMGLQRSDQLRELYESLALGEANPQTKRPSAALSPEDLTDAEWYFVICMSFVFGVGQGLPGRTLARNQVFWLCNAQLADTKVFSRSLLAKTASIQTVACFPHLGGVIELGSTERVPEDLNLIRSIKTSFLENPTAILNHVSYNITNNKNLICQTSDGANTPDNGHNQFVADAPDVDMCPPSYSSDNFAEDVLREETTTLMEGEFSQLQNWLFMDDAISNCLKNSISSSDCISQTHRNPETFAPLLATKKANEHCTNDAQECNQEKRESNGLQGNDLHYQSVLYNLLKSSHRLILDPHSINGSRGSSFVSWKKYRVLRTVVPQQGISQKLLKKVICEVARVQEKYKLDSSKRNGISNGLSGTATDDIDRNHVLSERKRREKMNERFMILGSLVPSGGKGDKVSVLDHTIAYLQQLEGKIEELQSNKEVMGRDSTAQTEPRDAIERTSDSNGPKGIDNSKKVLKNKRKACEIDKNGGRDQLTDNIRVNVTNKDVSIEISCLWRERVIYEVMEAISKLQLASETVQSSNANGMLSMTIRAKWKGLKVLSAGVIRLALQKVMRES